MSTIKSSNEHLTFNADGTSKEIRFQANGTQKASISSAGLFTSTTIDATKLTGNLPAISGASLTNLPADATKLPLAGGTLTGTVISPSFTSTAGGTFTTASGNDLNIVYPDSRSLFIKEAGTTHVTVDNTGKVGIGTTSPAGALQVVGATTLNNAALHVKGTKSTTNDLIPSFSVESATTGTAANGVGTSMTFWGSMSGQDNIQLGEIGFHNNNVSGAHGDFVVRTRPNGTVAERMRIDSSGNVGIGRTPEAWKSSMTALALGQSNAVYARSDNQAITLAKNFYHNSSSQDIAIATDHAAKLELNSGQIRFFTAGTTSSGSAISWNSALTIHDNGRSAFAQRIAIDGSSFSEMAITARCDSDSSKTWRGFSNTGNTHTYMINNNNAGVYMPFGNTSWSSHSDERVKENIVALGTVLPELLNMRCVKYNRIGDSGSDRTKIGFIAQDWESTPFSEVVDEDTSLVIESDGTVSTDFTSESTTAIKSIAYTETIPVLLKAIQELSAKVKALEEA